MNFGDFTEVLMEDRDEHYITLDCKLLEGKDYVLLINMKPTQYLVHTH